MISYLTVGPRTQSSHLNSPVGLGRWHPQWASPVLAVPQRIPNTLMRGSLPLSWSRRSGCQVSLTESYQPKGPQTLLGLASLCPASPHTCLATDVLACGRGLRFYTWPTEPWGLRMNKVTMPFRVLCPWASSHPGYPGLCLCGWTLKSGRL